MRVSRISVLAMPLVAFTGCRQLPERPIEDLPLAASVARWEPVEAKSWGVEAWDEWVLAPTRPRPAEPRVASHGATETLAPGSRDETRLIERPALESEHFAIVSSLAPGIVAECSEELERAWRSYAARWGEPPAGERVPVRVESVPFPSSELAGRSCYSPDAGVVTVQVRGRGTFDQEVLRHEAFHAFAARALPALPTFLEEGLATSESEALAEPTFARREAILALLDRRLTTPWRWLLALPYEQFHDEDGEAAFRVRTPTERRHYVLAGSFCELARRRPESAAGRVVAEMIERIRRGASREDAVARATARVTDEELDREWRAFARTLVAETSTLESKRGDETPPSAPPALELTERQVRDALDERHLRLVATVETARELVARARAGAIDPVAATIECWKLGHRDEADRLADLVPPWTRAEVPVTAALRDDGHTAHLELVVVRAPSDPGDRPLHVAFPPGTFARSEVSSDDLERYVSPSRPVRLQELAISGGAVATIPPGERVARVTVPVACANFPRMGPRNGQEYRLDVAPRGCAFDRLLVALATRPACDPAVAQLATWLVRDDPSWQTYDECGGPRGGLRTFAGRAPVLPDHAPEAARLLLDAAIDPRGKWLFAGARSRR